MSTLEGFGRALTQAEQQKMARLTTPRKIQDFLDRLPYSVESSYRCPLRVFREHTAHCFDGALFGAAALRRLGYPPLIINMIATDEDDDHILALYRCEGYWGALAKSNFVGLRFREPVYRNLRELVMSYFEQYYSVEREKSLRSYTVPLNLKAFDNLSWTVRDEPLEGIGERLDQIRRIPLLTRRMVGNLSSVDERSYKSGLFGANEAGLYRPPNRRSKKT